jgi:hypothetical protein
MKQRGGTKKGRGSTRLVKAGRLDEPLGQLQPRAGVVQVGHVRKLCRLAGHSMKPVGIGLYVVLCAPSGCGERVQARAREREGARSERARGARGRTRDAAATAW